MIFVVVEGGRPVRLAKSAGVAAYSTREAAERAARALGGTVIACVPADAATIDDAVTVTRARDEVAALDAALGVARRVVAAYRAAAGAERTESDGDVIARVSRMRRAIDAIRDLRIERKEGK